MHGRSDHVARPALADQLHARIPDSRLIWFDGGHLFSLMPSYREAFVTEVITFLAGHL